MSLRPREKIGSSFCSRSFARRIDWRATIAISAILLFLGALLWARRQDPFSRNWFTLRTADNFSFHCVAFLPKPVRRYPVIVYAHGSRASLINDGTDLRQMAELGFAAVSLEYNQTNEAAFTNQFEALLKYIGRQKWANTNAVAWVGNSMGANRLWDFALQHADQQPRLLVLLSGAGLLEWQTNNLFISLRCPIILIHGERDDIFLQDDIKRLNAVLQSNGVPAVLKTVPGAPHNMQPDREVIFHCIGEYCLTCLSDTNAWQNYHSIAEWEQEAPPFWLFCIPAAVWALGCFVWSQYRKPPPGEKFKLKPHEIVLRCVAAILAIWALSDTALHLATPHFHVSEKTLAIARKYLVQPKERTDFEFLAKQPIWQGVKLETLLTHAELANYNRELINWQLDETNYQNYVLSPIITGAPEEKLNWRRPLWEELYPRIRHENLAKDAATIVARHLRERVTIASIPNPARDVPTIWLRQITDEPGFEIIYVAALRSVGVPARLNKNGQAELFDGTEWQPAPRPIVESFVTIDP